MPTTIYSSHCSREMFSKCSWIVPGMHSPSTLEHISGFLLLLGLKKKNILEPQGNARASLYPPLQHCPLPYPLQFSVHQPPSLLSCKFFECSLLPLTQDLSKCSSLCLNALPLSTHKQHCLVKVLLFLQISACSLFPQGSIPDCLMLSLTLFDVFLLL